MAINNGTDPKVMVDQALAQHKIQLDNVKTASNLRHKEMKAQQGLAIADMQAASKIRIDKEMANAKKNGREQ
jgi:hypothetical protein